MLEALKAARLFPASDSAQSSEGEPSHSLLSGFVFVLICISVFINHQAHDLHNLKLNPPFPPSAEGNPQLAEFSITPPSLPFQPLTNPSLHRPRIGAPLLCILDTYPVRQPIDACHLI